MDFTVELLVDGEVVGENDGSVDVSFSTATVLLGEPRGGDVAGAAEAIFDDARVWRDGVNLLGNSSFESAVVGPTSDTSVIFDNWRAYHPANGSSAPSPARVAAPYPVHSGTWAGRIYLPSTSDRNNRYFFQDVEIATGDLFDLDFWIYPVSRTASAKLLGQILFDWDRRSGSPTVAEVTAGPDATTFQAWGVGGSAPPIPLGEWTHLVLRLQTFRSGFEIGQIGI